MVESGRISSLNSKVKVTGTLTSGAVKGVPPALQRYYRFMKDMAMKFCRHLQKDRSDELIDAVIREMK